MARRARYRRARWEAYADEIGCAVLMIAAGIIFSIPIIAHFALHH